MNLELYSSLLYQQMSAWCSYHTFEGAAAFLRRHAQEEMTHMQRLFDYLTDTGNLPRINTVESPFAEYSSLDEGVMLSLIFYKMPIKERYANIFYKRLGGLNGSPFFIKVQPFNLSQI